MRKEIFFVIVFIGIFQFKLFATEFCSESSTPIWDSQLDGFANESQGIACSDKCMYFASYNFITCLKKDAEQRNVFSLKWDLEEPCKDISDYSFFIYYMGWMLLGNI